MKKILLILIIVFLSGVYADVDNVNNSIYTLKETDDYSLVLQGEEDILINEYSSEDSIEAVLYDDNYVIYNGSTGIGLYIYDIRKNVSVLLNSPETYNSVIFYNKFIRNSNKLFIDVGVEVASMPKVCVYDLELLIKKIDTIENYDDILEASEGTQYLSLENYMNIEDVVYCTFDDDKYYYRSDFTDDQKISYILCDDSLCEQNQYVGGEKYISDWDGKNKKLIGVVEEGEIEKDEKLYIYSNYEPQPTRQPINAKNIWHYGVGALVILVVGVGIARRKKKK